jgi:nuclear pore complex protein Nup85
LIKQTLTARFEISLRDYFLLEYAELIQTTPQARANWRIVCDYLSAAGDEGRNRLRNFIIHISLQSPPKSASKDTNGTGTGGGMDVETSNVDEDRLAHITQIREACEELRLQDEWRTISKIMAERLIRKGEYGMAAAMCLQAEDSFSLSLIAERICDAYLSLGTSSSGLVPTNANLIRRRRIPPLGRDVTA